MKTISVLHYAMPLSPKATGTLSTVHSQGTRSRNNTISTLVSLLQQWDLTDAAGMIDNQLRPVGQFENEMEMPLYCDNYAMPDGYGAISDLDNDDRDSGPMEITYIGSKGKGTNVKTKAGEAVYETTGMKKDHNVPGAEYVGREGV
ncbi:hypothetical protein HJC23_001143 [Cyclotella cryptica]|uniref:Uncharacterized protein n=1 Tax=Cyclotella cryptica TaxID=29204 RepID=A0ABD3P5U0_9STRA|eukprot:CCRYP_017388-RA/>CCRYP_017388-RA protein AED:0.18 eAED:0.18 QI:0/0/0/1/1/1/2/0/145